MIYSDVTITVKGNTATLDNDLYLYKNDKNITINISIVNSIWNFAKKLENNIIEKTEATFFTLRWMKGDKVKKVFEEQQIKKGKCEFVITEELIDEDIEMGDYDFQISLLDEEKNSILSIPPVIEQIHINKHIFEDEDINTVGNAKVGIAKVGTYEQRSTENSEGLYNKKTWQDNEVITKEDLNTIEEGIYNNSTQCKDIVKQISSSSAAIKDIFANNELPRIYMASDKLGILNNKGDGKADCECEIKINNKTIKCYATGKVQGSSSVAYPGKNFTFDFYVDSLHQNKFKIDVGWGAQSKYCFKKNWIDITHTRNLSGARVVYDMVESRPSSDFKTNLQKSPRNGAVDGFPCKLYINGEFWGLYTWNIPKDTWMFGMDKNNSNHMVLCAETNNNGVTSNISSCEFRKAWNGIDGNDWSVEVGILTDGLKNSFNRCINFVMTSSDNEFKSNISEYFDLYSLLDYYLFSYFTYHIDGLGKNLLMITYDGVHWGAGLYDMDSIYGAYIDGSSFKSATCKLPSDYKETNSLLWQRIEKCFTVELKSRYAELRKGALSLGNIITHVEEIYDLIPDRVFKDDQDKWTGVPSKTTNTITRFRNYMRDRAVYVDTCINNLAISNPCTSISLDKSTLTFNDTNTQTLVATIVPTNTTDIVVWSVSPNGICTVNNGVVTPVSNGSCVITATCGKQSATCNVTVSGIAESKPCTAITLNTNTLTFTSSDTQTLIATPTPADTTDAIKWNVTPTGIATVKNGVVTPVADGQCTITVTCGSQTTTCTVTIGGLTHTIIQLTETTNSIPLINGYKLGDHTGIVEEKSGCFISDFIKVTEGQNLTYSVVNGDYLRVYGYNTNFNLCNEIVTGANPGNSTAFTIPSGVTYIRLQSFNGKSPATITIN